MPRFAANVSTMFPNLPVDERFAAARAIGFRAVEYLFDIQFSSVPGRHEPQFGEVNMPYLFETCDRLGYDGWIGCEYRPMTTASEGIGWGKPYGLGP